MNIDGLDMNDLDINGLNNAIQSINKSAECGPECESANTKEALKLAFEKAQKNLTTAPQQLNDAEKQYYLSTFGLVAYNEMLKQRYSDEIIQLNQNERLNLSKQKNELNSLVNEYGTSIIYLEKLNELEDKLKE